ncbi:YcxB family protein [Umezawaea sp. Da 62-37]|uniref:YcxB family protein n=1 Tax=Umezawaea sp. Da 62-37 TaxID=3075927 RepID=UPI0028F6CAD7|nr:YcxB family protein [Umezawaea sp. Da 62-37]WNV88703.1 YcxB family protein [Umezawaea sp. Da 62-37]
MDNHDIGAVVSGSVDFRWSPEPADWGDALRSAVPMFRWATWFSVVVAAGSVVLLLSGQTAPGLFGLGAAVVVAVLVPVQVRIDFGGHPLAAGTVTATADDHSLRMTVGEAARSELPWAHLPTWTETRRGFILRTEAGARGPMYAVPHRAFEDNGDRNRFRDLLVRHVGPAA